MTTKEIKLSVATAKELMAQVRISESSISIRRCDAWTFACATRTRPGIPMRRSR